MLQRMYQPLEHELELEKFFGPLDHGLERFVYREPLTIMVFTNRSGSSLIGEYLRASGAFSGFGEPLNYPLVIEHAQKFGISNLVGYLKWLMESLGDSKKAVGVKLSLDQVVMLLRAGIIPRIYPNVNWLYVYREDLLSQAISFSIAEQTGAWNTVDGDAGGEASFDAEDIKAKLLAVNERKQLTELFFATNGIEPLRISYEAFLKDTDAMVAQIGDWCGVAVKEIDKDVLHLKKQGGVRSRAYKEAFIKQYQFDSVR